MGSVLAGVALTPGSPTVPSAAARSPYAAPQCAQRIYARLFFGLAGPRGSVSETDWDTFLREVVVARFPRGLTVIQAKGHWRSAGEPLQREASRVLEIVYDETPQAHRLIGEIAALYKTRFEQDSVMVVRMPADVCF
jgi:hypothetical protein